MRELLGISLSISTGADKSRRSLNELGVCLSTSRLIGSAGDVCVVPVSGRRNTSNRTDGDENLMCRMKSDFAVNSLNSFLCFCIIL